MKSDLASGQAGNTVQITDTITNIGRGCADSVVVAYYISLNPDFYPRTAEYPGVWNPVSVCPDEQKTNGSTVTLPPTLTNREYFLIGSSIPVPSSPGAGRVSLNLINHHQMENCSYYQYLQLECQPEFPYSWIRHEYFLLSGIILGTGIK